MMAACARLLAGEIIGGWCVWIRGEEETSEERRGGKKRPELNGAFRFGPAAGSHSTAAHENERSLYCYCRRVCLPPAA
jgi:hypothetical protein